MQYLKNTKDILKDFKDNNLNTDWNKALDKPIKDLSKKYYPNN